MSTTPTMRRMLSFNRCLRRCMHSSSEFMPKDKWPTIKKREVKRFIIDCMKKVGTKEDHATSLAANLVAADYRGHYSHGLNRLDMYVHDIESGITVCDDEPTVVKESAATAYVDGKNLLGPVVGNFAMDIAIEKAKTSGVGWVAAKASNHYGIAGWYAMQACEQGLIGMSFTNTSPLVMPTRAKQVVLGTNPISLAAPGRSGDSFVLDMATSACALGKIELHDRKNHRMPAGWGADKHGEFLHKFDDRAPDKMSKDPKKVLQGGGLMPLGGVEETSGYKGYGLAMMVEIFCGILGDATYGPNIRKWKNTDRVANLGQCFIAVDPEAFASGFSDRLSDLMDTCRGLETIEDEIEVWVAGDPEKIHMAMCNSRGGIPYHPSQITYGLEMAKKLSVDPMKSTPLHKPKSRDKFR